MSPFASWLNRHAIPVVIVGAYVLAWATWAPLLGRELGDVAAIGPDFLILALGGGLMPSLVALAWRIAGGTVPAAARADLAGARAVPVRMIAALAVVPAMTLAAAGLQLLLGRPYDLGDVLSRLALGLAWPFMAAVGEELAWRGTLLPLLRARMGSLKAALLIGVLWGFWHLPSDWIGLKSQGVWFWPQFILQGPVLLTAHSVIMTWIWERTGGRTWSAVIYHFGITASAILLGNQVTLSGAQSFVGNLVGVLVVVLVAVAAGASLARTRGTRDRAVTR